MENKAHALVAGTFVLALMASLVAMAVWLTRDSGERHRFDISTAQAISGLPAQAGVRFRGVPVGKVESIGFDPANKGHVLVRISVDASTPITRSTFATILDQIQQVSPDNQASVQMAVSQIGAAAGSVTDLANALRPTLATLPALSRKAA